MLYELAVALKPLVSALNVFTYLTTRAGGAAFTAFVVSLALGPAVIRWLRALKIGQYIREEHVADLHALHKNKAGTPTMGGVLIILATVIAVLLWGRLGDRLLWVAMAAFFVLGCVGFLDDFIKLRRKKNEGLSAKAKFAGQIAVGLALGLYLVFNPITPGKTRMGAGDIRDWQALTGLLERELPALSPEIQQAVADAPLNASPGPDGEARILAALNRVIEGTDLYSLKDWPTAGLNGEATRLIEIPERAEREVQRLNRLLLESAYPDIFARDVRNLHTKVEIPGLKDVYVPLGLGYVLFVLVIIVGSSNAV
ncbi:MAG: hypothetical protein JXR94_16460, partial [Candidatus Hydrogenedentes bacterium]|nr:hypothetical protein [Candidatus Hydrogenedentota bacterium]